MKFGNTIPFRNRFLAGAVLLLTFGLSPAFSQTYGTALGLRLGSNNRSNTLGLTLNQKLLRRLTLEGIVQTDFSNNTMVHGLVKQHQNILTRRLNLYVGAGASLGNELSTFKNKQNNQIITTFDNKTVGVDLVAGVEVTLLKFNISVDYKPNFNITGRSPWVVGQVGVSARAVIVKESTQNKKKRKRRREKRRKEREKEKKDESTPLFQEWYQKLIK